MFLPCQIWRSDSWECFGFKHNGKKIKGVFLIDIFLNLKLVNREYCPENQIGKFSFYLYFFLSYKI